MEISVSTLVGQFEDFLDATATARQMSEKCRDYRDHKQWTKEEVDALEKRGQAAIVNNRISRKVNTLVGIKNRTKTDPKAFPRTQKHEKGAEAITDALRFVTDNNDFDYTSADVFEGKVVEGYNGAVIEVEKRGNDLEVVIKGLNYDRIYFDPHSRRRDHKDGKYSGIVLWMDLDDAVALNPDLEQELNHLVNTTNSSVTDDTFKDRPEWIDRKRKRLRVCQHYFLHQDVWHVAFFTNELFIIEPKPSNYLDEFGEPENPMELETAYISRDNERYGEVRGMLDMQDEVNHRHSKYLHLLSSRQTYSNSTAIQDTQTAKEELSKADGHVEIGMGKFGEDFGIIPTNDMGNAQFQLLQEAKNELDSNSANASLSGTQEQTLSGKAEQLRQDAGLLELDILLYGHKNWEKRVYRQIWNRIKQYWDEEKWIRVTDDESNIKWIGLNYPFTVADALEEKIQEGDEEAQMLLQQLTQAQDPRLNQVLEIRNNVNELDVDIIIEDSPDVVNVQQEQFELLTRLIPTYGPEKVPFESIIKLSNLRNKDKFLDSLQTDPRTAQIQQVTEELAIAGQQAEVQDKQLSAANKQADLAVKESTVIKNNEEALQKSVETDLLINQPERVTNVSV